jgi:hypothetical protein
VTVVPDTHIDDASAGRSTRRPGRVIAVGVRDHEYDSATLGWAQYEATSELDMLHVVHGFIPLHLDGCGWDPVRPGRDARAVLGRRITAEAVQRVHVHRPDLHVTGSAIPGLPEDVLYEFSLVADLLVIGDDADPMARRRIASRIQRQAQCPVVTVPHGYRRPRQSGPVTVVTTSDAPSSRVMRFAADAAQRHGVELRVAANPLDDRDWRSVASTSALIVAGTESADALRRLNDRGCPAVIVPT